MLKKAKKSITFVILFLMTTLVVVLGAQSFSKYYFEYSKELVGYYVDYRLSHTGDGKSAVIENISSITEKDDNGVSYQYDYVGFLTFSVSNVLDGKVSQRDVDISLRTPTLKETTDGAKDAWGSTFSIANDSKYYEVELVSSSGDSLNTSSAEYKDLTHFPEKVSKTSYITLKVKRRTTEKPTKNGSNWTNGASVPQLTGVEQFSIIIESMAPYKDIHVFNVKVASTLVMISSIETTYYGFDVVEVQIQTSRIFTFSDEDDEVSHSYLPVKITLDYSNLIFDEQRFIIATEYNYKKLSNPNAYENGYYLSGDTITLFVPAASSLTVYFIKNISESSITAKAVFKSNTNDEVYYTDHIAGAISMEGTGESCVAKIH